MIKVKGDFNESELINVLIDDSITVKVGDAVAITTTSNTIVCTNATGDVAGDKKPLGVVVGFATEKAGVYPTTGQDPTNTPNQITTGAANVSTDKYHAVILPFKENMKFEIDMNAAGGSTTLGNMPFTYFNLADCRQIAENSVVAADDVSAPLQVLSYGLVPGQTTKLLGSFAKRRIS